MLSTSAIVVREVSKFRNVSIVRWRSVSVRNIFVFWDRRVVMLILGRLGCYAEVGERRVSTESYVLRGLKVAGINKLLVDAFFPIPSDYKLFGEHGSSDLNDYIFSNLVFLRLRNCFAFRLKFASIFYSTAFCIRCFSTLAFLTFSTCTSTI
jgi:hypothetical protein